MKASELREKNSETLKQELVILLKEQFNLRMQKSSRQLTRGHHLKRVRRSIARVLTILREKEGVVA